MSEVASKPPPLPESVSAPRLASMWQRIFAFLMDTVLIGMLAAFLLVKILLPQEHPEGFEAVATLYRTYEAQVETAIETGAETPPPPKFEENEAILKMASYAQQIVLLLFFLYFAACEWLMKGSSIGKRVFGMRSVMLGSTFPPTPLQAILRGAIKAFAVVGYPPFTWALLLVAVFMSGRRSVHDLLARTVVIQDSMILPPVEG